MSDYYPFLALGILYPITYITGLLLSIFRYGWHFSFIKYHRDIFVVWKRVLFAKYTPSKPTIAYAGDTFYERLLYYGFLAPTVFFIMVLVVVILIAIDRTEWLYYFRYLIHPRYWE